MQGFPAGDSGAAGVEGFLHSGRARAIACWQAAPFATSPRGSSAGRPLLLKPRRAARALA